MTTVTLLIAIIISGTSFRTSTKVHTETKVYKSAEECLRKLPRFERYLEDKYKGSIINVECTVRKVR